MGRPLSVELNEKLAIEMFLNGASVNKIANDLGVSRNVIDRRLRSHGIEPRTQLEANRLMAENRTPEENARNATAAHRASKGRKATHAERIRVAKTRELTQSQADPSEAILNGWLNEMGIWPVPQKAIDVYNTDLAVHPVAIEIWGGGWHTSGEHALLYPKRTAKFFELGWDLLIVAVSDRMPLTHAVADRIFMFLQAHTSCNNEVGIVAGHGWWPIKITKDISVPPLLWQSELK